MKNAGLFSFLAALSLLSTLTAHAQSKSKAAPPAPSKPAASKPSAQGVDLRGSWGYSSVSRSWGSQNSGKSWGSTPSSSSSSSSKTSRPYRKGTGTADDGGR